MDYIERLMARRAGLKALYTDEETAPEHRGDVTSVLVNVLVDVELAARVAGASLGNLITAAEAVADREWYFAATPLRTAQEPVNQPAVDDEAPEGDPE